VIPKLARRRWIFPSRRSPQALRSDVANPRRVAMLLRIDFALLLAFVALVLMAHGAL
jgi:hypothetical protein